MTPRILAAAFAILVSAMAFIGHVWAEEERFALSASKDEWGGIELTWEIAPGHYLYRDKLSAEAPGGEAMILETPQGDLHGDVTFGEVEVFRRKATALVMDPGSEPFTVRWQGCEEGKVCYPPEAATVDPETLLVSALDSAAPSADGPAFRLAREEGLVDGLLSGGGRALVVVTFLGLGLLLAFTPCVLPMYPIVAGILAREGEALTPARGFLMSGTYALALAAAFAAAGAAAGLAGEGVSVLHTPLAAGVLAVLFTAFAAAMFGAFDMALPSRLATAVSRAAPRGRGGFGSAAILGLSSSLVLGPCVTAPLAGALAYVAQGGDAALGAAALFALGIGKSLPLVAMSAAGGGLLPRAGAWMRQVKELFGFGFLAAAAWTAAPLLPVAAAPVMTATLALSFVPWAFLRLPGTPLLRVIASVGAAAYGLSMLASAAAGSPDPFLPGRRPALSGVAFVNGPDVASVQAILAEEAGKRPVMVYFSAGWCVECLRLDRTLWPKAATARALYGIRLVKADSSAYGPEEARLMKEMEVKGPPTVVFFGRDGSEVPGTRIEGAPSAAGLAASAAKARSAP